MSTTLPSLSKTPSPQELQDYLNAIALDLRQTSAAGIKKQSDEKKDVLTSTAVVTNDLIDSLFQKIPMEALEQVGKYIISHPEAIAIASTAAAGAVPNAISVGVLGLMILVMHSATASSITATATESLEGFLKENKS